MEAFGEARVSCMTKAKDVVPGAGPPSLTILPVNLPLTRERSAPSRASAFGPPCMARVAAAVPPMQVGLISGTTSFSRTQANPALPCFPVALFARSMPRAPGATTEGASDRATRFH